MTVQFNHDKTIDWTQRHNEHFSKIVTGELDRFGNITRVEVHLKDENGPKEGVDDIRCLLEARVQGRQPVAVTNQADSIEKSIVGALSKAVKVLEKMNRKD